MDIVFTSSSSSFAFLVSHAYFPLLRAFPIFFLKYRCHHIIILWIFRTISCWIFHSSSCFVLFFLFRICCLCLYLYTWHYSSFLFRSHSLFAFFFYSYFFAFLTLHLLGMKAVMIYRDRDFCLFFFAISIVIKNISIYIFSEWYKQLHINIIAWLTKLK